MKLTPNPIVRLQNAERHFAQIEAIFGAFVQKLSFFKDSTCPTRGVIVQVADDGKTVEVNYKTVRIAFRFLVTLTAQGAASGLVVCNWADRDDKSPKVELGRFAFDRSGRTNYEDPTDGDPVDLEGMAPEIVSHFLLHALEQSAA